MRNTAYYFSGSELADYIDKIRDLWNALREDELDRMQAALDDMTERCRTAERRGWDAAETHCLMTLKSYHTPSRKLPDCPASIEG